VTKHRQRTRTFRIQTTFQDLPLPRSRRRSASAANSSRPRIVRASTSLWPLPRPQVLHFTSAPFQIMSAFDPSTVRKAVEEFTPRRPEKFQDLMPAKDVIAELRQKRASYRSIADLLTQHCLPTSKTAIAMFCHQVLGENVRPRKRPGRRKPSVPAVSTDETSSQQAVDAPQPLESSQTHNGDEAQPTRTRGPRIAQVRMLKPQST
jgi:hypothetical protein